MIHKLTADVSALRNELTTIKQHANPTPRTHPEMHVNSSDPVNSSATDMPTEVNSRQRTTVEKESDQPVAAHETMTTTEAATQNGHQHSKPAMTHGIEQLRPPAYVLHRQSEQSGRTRQDTQHSRGPSQHVTSPSDGVSDNVPAHNDESNASDSSPNSQNTTVNKDSPTQTLYSAVLQKPMASSSYQVP